MVLQVVVKHQQGEFQSTGGENIVLIGVSSVILYTAILRKGRAAFIPVVQLGKYPNSQRYRTNPAVDRQNPMLLFPV